MVGVGMVGCEYRMPWPERDEASRSPLTWRYTDCGKSTVCTVSVRGGDRHAAQAGDVGVPRRRGGRRVPLAGGFPFCAHTAVDRGTRSSDPRLSRGAAGARVATPTVRG